MAEENPSKPAQTGGSSSGRKGNRRRYSRNRKRSRKSRGDSNESTQEGRGATAVRDEGSLRARRDRRRRSKEKGETQNADQLRQTLDDDLGVLPVESVSVYTHVIRPSIRDSYEFRPEHFSKVSRKLEDFRIDLSLLFPEDRETGQEDNVPPEEEANNQTGIID